MESVLPSKREDSRRKKEVQTRGDYLM